jgi:hypothetical protein
MYAGDIRLSFAELVLYLGSRTLAAEVQRGLRYYERSHRRRLPVGAVDRWLLNNVPGNRRPPGARGDCRGKRGRSWRRGRVSASGTTIRRMVDDRGPGPRQL